MADDAEPAPALLALPPAPVDAGGPPWFAIDGLGQIALFEPGDAGVIPAGAARLLPNRHALGRSFAPALARAGVLSYEAADLFDRFDRFDLDDPGHDVVGDLLGQTLVDAPPRFDQSHAGVLLQLRSDAAAAGSGERLSQLGLLRLPSSNGDYAWGDLDSPTLRELWREGWVRRAVLGHALAPARMGLFEFGPNELGPNEDVVERRDAPTIGLRVHALPTRLRSQIAAVAFEEIDFRYTTVLRVVHGRDHTVGPRSEHR